MLFKKQQCEAMDIVKNIPIPFEAYATKASIWAEILLEEHRVDILS